MIVLIKGKSWLYGYSLDTRHLSLQRSVVTGFRLTLIHKL